MGFRNPFRITLDDDDVAYITDYSPDSQTPTGVPRPGRHRPDDGRPRAGELRLAAVLLAGPAVLPVELQHLHAAGHPAAGARVRQPDPRPGEHLAVEHRPDLLAADRRAGAVVLLPGQQPDQPAGHAVRGVLHGRTRRAPARSCSPSSAPAASGRTARPSTTTTRRNPNPTKFPEYYDGAIFFGEFTRDYLREIRLDSHGDVFKINNLLNCGPAPTTPDPAVHLRQPDGHDVGRRRQLLPADLRRRLLRRQPGRRAGEVQLRQGPAGADRGAERHADRRRRAADRAVLQRGLARPGPGRLDLVRVGLRRQRHRRLGRPEPVVHLHRQRRLHGAADGHRLQRQDRVGQHDHHGRQHLADGRTSPCRSTAGCSPSATRSRSR